jgi:hypothetical protein
MPAMKKNTQPSTPREGGHVAVNNDCGVARAAWGWPVGIDLAARRGFGHCEVRKCDLGPNVFVVRLWGLLFRRPCEIADA